MINAPGYFSPRPFLDHSGDDYDLYMQINRGVFFVTQAVARNMRTHKSGSIVNIGSMWAKQAVKATPSSAYSMAKAGLHALTQHLAMELADHGIRVNAVSPAVVETPIYGAFIEPAQIHSLTQAALGFSRPLLFEKSSRLHGNKLQLEYSVQNLSASPVSFLYASHPLFAVELGDEVFLPVEVGSLRLDYSRGERLGRKGDLVSWPVTAQGVSLHRVGIKTDGTAEMFYTTRLKDGAARIFRARSRQSLEISFDVAKLPYLGIWLCYGGWPDDASDQLQYAVALEPTTCPHNTLELAQVSGTAVMLESQQSFQFAVTITVVES